jgi:hypothetical protein
MSTSDPFLGKVILKRALGGDNVEVGLRAGDKVSVRGTQIWSAETNDDGTGVHLTQEGSVHPSWSMYLTFPNETPKGDTIRVYTRNGKKTRDYFTEKYPHPRQIARLRSRENLHFFDEDSTRHSYFATSSSALELRPATLSIASPSQKPRTWTILPNDKVWVEAEGRPGTYIPIGSESGTICEYEVSDEIQEESLAGTCRAGA